MMDDGQKNPKTVADGYQIQSKFKKVKLRVIGVSEIDADAGLEKKQVAIVSTARNVATAGVEHPSDVGMQVPVQLAH